MTEKLNFKDLPMEDSLPMQLLAVAARSLGKGDLVTYDRLQRAALLLATIANEAGGGCNAYTSGLGACIPDRKFISHEGSYIEMCNPCRIYLLGRSACDL